MSRRRFTARNPLGNHSDMDYSSQRACFGHVADKLVALFDEPTYDHRELASRMAHDAWVISATGIGMEMLRAAHKLGLTTDGCKLACHCGKTYSPRQPRHLTNHLTNKHDTEYLEAADAVHGIAKVRQLKYTARLFKNVRDGQGWSVYS